MRVHAVIDEKGNLVACGPVPPEGDGPKVQLRAGPGQTRRELELASEFEGKSPVDLHKSLAASDLTKYTVEES
jgi:hypothetical protein